MNITTESMSIYPRLVPQIQSWRWRKNSKLTGSVMVRYIRETLFLSAGCVFVSATFGAQLQLGVLRDSETVPLGVLLTASSSSERHLCERSCLRAAFVLCKLFFLSSSGMVAIISLSFAFSWSSWHEEAAFQFWHLGLNVCQRMSEEAECIVFMRMHVQRRVMRVEVKDVCTRQGHSLSALIVLLSTGREAIH